MKMPVFKSVPVEKVMAMEHDMYDTIRRRRESGDKKEKDVFCGLCLQKTSFLYGYKVIKEKITKKQCEILAKFKLIKY